MCAGLGTQAFWQHQVCQHRSKKGGKGLGKQEGRIDLLRSFSSDAMAWPDICTRHFGHNHSLLLACQRKIGRGKNRSTKTNYHLKISFDFVYWTNKRPFPFFLDISIICYFLFACDAKKEWAKQDSEEGTGWNKASTVFKSDLKRF